MSRPRIFVDGDAGTTGLRIREWLADRDDLERVGLPEALRKDPRARRDALNGADLVVLCLPDAAAREAVDWIERPEVRVLDASTAHRVAAGWVYGLPELGPGQREALAGARRVANPGCYPIGPILFLRPLVEAGLLPATAPLSVHGLSGYSGGGRALIERWEDPGRALLGLPHDAPYALERIHKHVPEITVYAGLAQPPQFLPAVGPFRCGMRVSLPLHASLLASGATPKRVWDVLADRYRDEPFVRVAPLADPPATDEHSLDPRALNDTNAVELAVLANAAGHLLLVARLDNLGKGAAGSAIQNLNLMLGLGEGTGLRG